MAHDLPFPLGGVHDEVDVYLSLTLRMPQGFVLAPSAQSRRIAYQIPDTWATAILEFSYMAGTFLESFCGAEFRWFPLI